MKNLKEVPADKKKSLGKLPEKVRNKMGYAKMGKMMKAKKGKDIKIIEAVAKKPIIGSGSLTQMKQAAKSAKKKSIGGEMKSTKGYGAARTSGMGLQDENLIPGKSMDYYKDLM